MTAADLVDRLAEHRTLGPTPREELTWIASHVTLHHLNAGDVLTAKRAQVESVLVVLSGRLGIFVDRGAGPQKVMEWRRQDSQVS